MPKINPSLIAAGLFGFSAVALGAYAEHGLRADLAAHDYDSLQTALRYQLLHAVLLAAIGLRGSAGPGGQWLKAAALCLTAGVCCFCGGIALAVIAGAGGALRFVPLGGVLLMAGWLLLALSGLNIRRR